MNNFPENQDTLKNQRLYSENSTSKNEGNYRNKSIFYKVYLIGDSHLNRINKENFQTEFEGDWV